MKNLKSKKMILVVGIAVTTFCSFISLHSLKNQKAFVGTLHHVGLSVNDLDKLEKWYTLNFNLHEEQHFEMKEPGIRTVTLVADNGLRFELIELKGSKREKEFTDPLDASGVQGYGHLAIEVNNVNTAFESLIAGGAGLVSKPSPAVQKGAFFAYVKDPEGNLIELIQPAKH